MNAREIFEIDFIQAAKRRDYNEMADIYEEMDRYDSYDDNDDPAAELNNGDLPSLYCFAEILPGNRIKLPVKAQNYIRHFGSEYIYCLEEENLKLSAVDKSLGEKYNNLIYEFYEEQGIDTKTVEITDTIYLDDLAMRTLGFRVRDIVKIWLMGDMIVVSEVDGYSEYLNGNP